MSNTQETLLIINVVLTAVIPVVIAMIAILKRVHKSSCCGGTIEMNEVAIVAQEDTPLKPEV